jgi:hypothetical protein
MDLAHYLIDGFRSEPAMYLIINHHAGRQATAANASYPLHSEFTILTGFTFLGTCRQGYRLCYSFCSAQMTRSPMTDLD